MDREPAHGHENLQSLRAVGADDADALWRTGLPERHVGKIAALNAIQRLLRSPKSPAIANSF